MSIGPLANITVSNLAASFEITSAFSFKLSWVMMSLSDTSTPFAVFDSEIIPVNLAIVLFQLCFLGLQLIYNFQ